MAVRDSKVALQTLLSKGQIGDDTWNHLLETEKELEAELLEVVGEANHFRPGWGNIIFAHASDMLQHEKNKKIYEVLEQDRVKARESECTSRVYCFITEPVSLLQYRRKVLFTTSGVLSRAVRRYRCKQSEKAYPSLVCAYERSDAL